MNFGHIMKTYAAALAAVLLAACGGPKDVEVGPYTVSVIEKDVYHIQDFNSSNPAQFLFSEIEMKAINLPTIIVIR